MTLPAKNKSNDVLRSIKPRNIYSSSKSLTDLRDQNFSTRYRISRNTHSTAESVNATGTISNNSILSFDFDEWLAKDSISLTKKGINLTGSGIRNS